MKSNGANVAVLIVAAVIGLTVGYFIADEVTPFDIEVDEENPLGVSIVIADDAEYDHYIVDWGDESEDSTEYTADSAGKHTYSEEGRYTVSVTAYDAEDKELWKSEKAVEVRNIGSDDVSGKAPVIGDVYVQFDISDGNDNLPVVQVYTLDETEGVEYTITMGEQTVVDNWCSACFSTIMHGIESYDSIVIEATNEFGKDTEIIALNYDASNFATDFLFPCSISDNGDGTVKFSVDLSDVDSYTDLGGSEVSYLFLNGTLSGNIVYEPIEHSDFGTTFTFDVDENTLVVVIIENDVDGVLYTSSYTIPAIAEVA